MGGKDECGGAVLEHFFGNTRREAFGHTVKVLENCVAPTLSQQADGV